MSMTKWLLMLALLAFSALVLAADPPASNPQGPGSVQILQTFDQQHQDTAEANSAIPTAQKHRILFYLGGTLLLLVLVTGSLGIGVGIFDKPWFVWHMVAAGLTMTLAVVHAIVAMVWFFPF